MLEKNDKIRDYTLIKFLGKGQFGEVWLAEKQLQLQFSSRKFRHALKFLSNLGNEIDLKSAEAEIDTWIEASGHPNVMSVLDMFTHKKHIIIVSEFAEGGSLKRWLNKSDGKAPSQEKALKMMLGILSGIEHLHSRNVVHRDLKPDNILLHNNFPRITDFGISRIVSTDSMLTNVIGSPAYMSPESFDGNKSPLTDIWSAGVILYELLTGGHPFHSETIFGLAAAIQQDTPKPMPEYVPEELRQVVETALQKDLAKRFQTAREMRVALEQATHYLKVLPKSEAAVTERLIDVSGYIDPPAKTEPIVNKVGELALNANIIDVVEKPDTPSQENIVLETQPSIIDSTDDPAERGKIIQTQSESEMVHPGQRIRGGRIENRLSGVRLVFIAGLVGAGILQYLAVFVVVPFISRAFITGGSIPGGTRNSENFPATNANLSTAPQSQKLPEPPSGMAYLPGGEFMMGRDVGKILDERPAHKATVDPFLMDIYEVTNEKYAEFVKETNRTKLPQGWKKNNYPTGEGKFPVVGVDWNDADEYAKWAGKRLPTEKEWEFAARGKDGLLYPWGNDWKPGNANADGASQTFSEVGKFEGSSPFGIYDMVGNAGEWTADDFKAYPNGSLSPAFKGKANLKSIRGNDFMATKEFATSSYRIGWPATGSSTYSRTGFRCVKDVGK